MTTKKITLNELISLTKQIIKEYNNSTIEGKNVKIEDFKIGDTLEVIGWVMMDRVDPGLYKITAIDEYPSITFVKINERGNIVSKKQHRFPTWSIIGKFGNADWEDLRGNGIRLIKNTID
jgi:hypothetical protein